MRAAAIRGAFGAFITVLFVGIAAATAQAFLIESIDLVDIQGDQEVGSEQTTDRGGGHMGGGGGHSFGGSMGGGGHSVGRPTGGGSHSVSRFTGGHANVKGHSHGTGKAVRYPLKWASKSGKPTGEPTAKNNQKPGRETGGVSDRDLKRKISNLGKDVSPLAKPKINTGYPSSPEPSAMALAGPYTASQSKAPQTSNDEALVKAMRDLTEGDVASMNALFKKDEDNANKAILAAVNALERELAKYPEGPARNAALAAAAVSIRVELGKLPHSDKRSQLLQQVNSIEEGYLGNDRALQEALEARIRDQLSHPDDYDHRPANQNFLRQLQKYPPDKQENAINAAARALIAQVLKSPPGKERQRKLDILINSAAPMPSGVARMETLFGPKQTISGVNQGPTIKANQPNPPSSTGTSKNTGATSTATTKPSSTTGTGTSKPSRTTVVVGGGGPGPYMPVVSGTGDDEEEPAAPGGSVYPPGYSRQTGVTEPEAGACGVVNKKLSEITELMAKFKEMKATLSAGETMSPEMFLLFGKISEKLKAVREFAQDCGEEIPRMITELEEILMQLEAS